MAKSIEYSQDPPMTIIARMFKFLNEEKKKHKTREALLNKIRDFMLYMSIPKGFERFILELYLLNYREDGDYSELSKNNFIDPRQQPGKKVANTNSSYYTTAKLPFQGSNLRAYWRDDIHGKPMYIVTSYGWYPIYLFKDNKWYVNRDTYSISTAKQISNARPDMFEGKITRVSQAEMDLIIRGKGQEDLMKQKLQTLKKDESKLISRVMRSYRVVINNSNYIIKYKIKSINTDGTSPIVDVDIYDVVNANAIHELPTSTNYVLGELDGVTPKKVEDYLFAKISHEFDKYGFDDEFKIRFNFNHLKK